MMDLKSIAFVRGGSSPPSRTNKLGVIMRKNERAFFRS